MYRTIRVISLQILTLILFLYIPNISYFSVSVEYERKPQSMSLQEKELLSALKQDNPDAFSALFKAYYKDLILYGGSILPEKEVIEDIIQNIFLKLWSDRHHLVIETSLKRYLIRAVKNSCFDELRHRAIVNTHRKFVEQNTLESEEETENQILYSELNQDLEEAIRQLPEALREAFELSRIQGMKYEQIAERLKVSVRTIEVRISKALPLLRTYLKDYFILLICVILY